MAVFSRVKVWVSNEVLTAADLNAEFDNILNNMKPAGIEGASANVAAMQANVDPGGVGTESLASDLLGEIQRLRFTIKRIAGTAQWYVAPASDIATMAAQITALQASITANAIPVGTVLDWTSDTAPNSKYLFLRGQAVSRSTYADLFALWGTTYGAGDGSLTFNVQDRRGLFMRGRTTGPQGVSGTGTASSDNATFTAHGIPRTGMKIIGDSGTLSGISINNVYYAIVIDANTLAFAGSLADAYAGTKIAISGANSLVISQAEDQDAASRLSPVTGATSNTLGSIQDDATRAHSHIMFRDTNTNTGTLSTASQFVGRALSAGSADDYVLQGSSTPATVGRTLNTCGSESRPTNMYTNYVVRALA